MEQKELRELEDRCIQEQPPECVAACPVHLDARALMAEVARGDFGAGAKILKKTLPFPGIISRVCDQPCRAVCKRGGAGDPVSIRGIEKACLDWAEEARDKLLPLPKREGRVAIVGGGLSGLTAAFDLAKKGYTAVVFERDGRLGGSLWHFSEEELPREVISKDLQALERVGVDVRLGMTVGESVAFEEICDAFDAVYIAVGELHGEPRDRFPSAAFGLPADETGHIEIDPVTFSTAREGVFAGGSLRRAQIVRSPIQSMADGRRAAISIDRYLQKVSLTASRAGEGSVKTRLFTSLEGVEPLAAVPAEEAGAGYSRDEAVSEAKRCIQCQCLECVKVCEYLNSFKSYPKRYIRQIYNNLSIVMGHRNANKLINSCSLCGLCREVCPEDLHMGMVCKKAREVLVEQGKMPPSAHDFPLRDMAFSNSGKCALARHQPGTEASRFLFFPGCQLSASSPEHVRAVYTTLMEKLDGGVGIMLGCCGAPADWSGRVELFQSTLEEFKTRWQEMGRPQLVLACSSCTGVFKTHLPEVPVVSLWELFDRFDLPQAAGPPGRRRPIALHDPCTTRHEPSIQECVRSLLRKLGYDIEELPLGRDKTECCGYGGLMFFGNPELAGKTIERRIAQSPTDYAVYCAMCRDYFAARGKRTVHLLDLLFEPAVAVDSAAARRGPGYSQRHENRARLKEALLKDLWGENVAEREGFETIGLILSAGVQDLMEERLILKEDIQRVIQHAERTGARLLNHETGHYLAHHKPTSVTYWVEYSPAGEAFQVHNIYSHRMEIVEDAKS